MATNWNEILSNTSNLNDVLSILKKVLAGLEVKADITTIDEALQDIEGLKVDIGAEVENVNTALDQFQAQADEVIAQGFYTGYATETALKASLPSVSEMRARADDTRKIWRWNRTSAVGVTPITGTWIDTGLSDLDQSKNYTDEEVSSLGISSANNPSISVAIVDDEDNRTWLEADGEGKPTEYGASLILEKIDPNISLKIQDGLLEAGIEQITSPEVSVAIVDDEDNRTWLEADGEGKPTDYATECFKDKLGLAEVKLLSGPDIVGVGDSMTANGTYLAALKTLLQNAGSTANTYNMGVGGETSVTICARQGGNPFVITAVGGFIPASTTPVAVTLEPINGETVRPLLQGAGTFTGYLGDIHGTLNLVEPSGNSSSWQADNYYTFARTTAGSEITLNRPTAFYLDVAAPRLGDIHIIWIGQNGPNNTRAISDAKAMIQRMQALDKRFLVISKPGGTTAQDAEDAVWFSEFGRRFIPIRQYMVKYGLADAGITPTSQDTTDIANGTVPTSLRIDGVHWNAQGYTILANVAFKRLKEMGWI